jgi:Uma2 family endonuclease
MAQPTLRKQGVVARDEYLEMERRARYKSEYYSGEIFAMTGGSPSHSMICFNLNGEMREAIRNRECFGFESNMKLEIAEANAFVYPDLMVVCGETVLAEGTGDAITNPLLVAEVLSASTESFDRGRKFEYYRMVPSLQEYLLISQEEPKIESYYKEEENRWIYTTAKGLDQALPIQSLGFSLSLKEVYRKVNLTPDAT